MRALRGLPLLAPALVAAHTTADAHVHELDVGSLLLLAVIVAVAVWIDRRWRR